MKPASDTSATLTAKLNKPQQTTKPQNNNKQHQTTTNHNKPQQTTTNHNKPQQTTTNNKEWGVRRENTEDTTLTIKRN